MSSTFEVPVVPVMLRPHPNADSLSIVDVDGYQVVVRTEDWKDRAQGAYVPPDSVVDTSRPEFEFLGKHNRIRAVRLRGELSFGLLVPAPLESMIGEDVAEALGVVHYQPPESLYDRPEHSHRVGKVIAPPPIYVPKYDLENLRKYPHIFEPGEELAVTEKIHGANGRWVWDDGKLHCGSRNEWKEHDGGNIWSRVALENPELEEFCRKRPGWIVFAEVYGWVQDLTYGRKQGEIDYAVFDLMYAGKFAETLGMFEICRNHGLKRVPVLGITRYVFEDIVEQWTEGASFACIGERHPREGIVLKPLHERTNQEVGRVALKVVSSWYLTRKE